jgi:hypothetical protein
MTGEFALYLACAFTGACVGAGIVWGIWLALAHAFLPKKLAVALIEWQKAMSQAPEGENRTDATNSVTV